MITRRKQPRGRALWTQMPGAKISARRPKKRLRAVSAKRATEQRRYLKLRAEFLKIHSCCAVYPYLNATEVHHRRGRRGNLLCDVRFWLPVSKSGHETIHHSPLVARERGWICCVGEWNKS